jgi:hypothetical protein
MKLSRIAQLGLSVIHEISLEKSYGLVGQDHIAFAIRHSQAFNDLSFVNKCIFFEDACTSVTDIPGASYKFTDWHRNFLNEVSNLRATVTNTRDFKPYL